MLPRESGVGRFCPHRLMSLKKPRQDPCQMVFSANKSKKIHSGANSLYKLMESELSVMNQERALRIYENNESVCVSFEEGKICSMNIRKRTKNKTASIIMPKYICVCVEQLHLERAQF